MKKTVLITAGEASGDIHAANLIKNLKTLNPNLRFFGIGGKRMEAEGVELVESMDRLSIIGVSEVFAKLKYVRGAYKGILNRIKDATPHIAVLVDYPGFNLALAKALKKRKIPVMYYITPQVWAWGKSRIYLIRKYIDKAIVILRFEEDLFKGYGVDAAFVGHPLLDLEKSKSPDRKSYGLDEKRMTIALLPGSRESEVRRMLPVMLKTAIIISGQKNVQFVLLRSSSVEEGLYDNILKKSNIPITQLKDDTYGCLNLADFVFTTSGTATLESAIMEKPMLITYKTSLLTAILFKIFARTRFIGLVNIIAGKEVSPEVLQYDARPKALASRILAIISSKEKMEKQVQNLRWVKHALGTPGASMRAARIVAEHLHNRASA